MRLDALALEGARIGSEEAGPSVEEQEFVAGVVRVQVPAVVVDRTQLEGVHATPVAGALDDHLEPFVHDVARVEHERRPHGRAGGADSTSTSRIQGGVAGIALRIMGRPATSVSTQRSERSKRRLSLWMSNSSTGASSTSRIAMSAWAPGTQRADGAGHAQEGGGSRGDRPDDIGEPPAQVQELGHDRQQGEAGASHHPGHPR